MELVGAEDAPEGPSVVLDCDGLPDGGVLADSGALPVCEARRKWMAGLSQNSSFAH
jgi:hypothetical protein